jgi:ubiquinone/menaquinone biosynthesis C-methylase UbiE
MATRDSGMNLWDSAAHALEYLARADSIPHRTEGEAELIEWLPLGSLHVLDLGSGDGRLLGLVKLARPDSTAVALDFSDTMLERLGDRFGLDRTVRVLAHDLTEPLPDSLGSFDAVVSSFAIHHLPHPRKRALYQEVFRLLRPGGVFCNLEHVSSPTPGLHEQFLARLGVAPPDEDPSNKLIDLETQLAWLREVGFTDVDCHWKWRELALMAGSRPVS